VQSTIALGKHDLSDYIYVTVSMTDSVSTGVLSCIDKKTGEVVWEHKAYYAWSSPVCVYNTDGSGVVIYCTSQGEVFMLDGLTGKVLSQMQMNGNVEASPAVYNDRLVVGTRNCMIYGVQLK
jgi:outer membrane protein assembly factor BamB